MMSAAKGAEPFYRTDTHITRQEGVELAKQLDDLTSQVTTGCFAVNSSPDLTSLAALQQISHSIK